MCLLEPLPVFDMRLFSLAATFSLIASSVGGIAPTPSIPLSDAIDAVSVTLPSETSTAEVRALIDGQWTAWQSLTVENEQDPSLLESNLVMFPESADDIDIRGEVTAVHPVRVSSEPVHYTVAATTDVAAPRIISRDDWGADESLRFRTTPSSSGTNTPSETAGDNGGATSQRVKDCEEAQLNYPNEFKTTGRITREENGNKLLWAHTYSRTVELIAVHHTAMKVEGDKRSGEERMRALYQYHATNRGWGDIGYHYLVDEDGKIYEGKAGGDYVIGGHAYCNNTGTIGVALLGNFEIEQPTQKQLKALQWLLADLAEKYDIDPSKEITFHGKKTMPIVGHRDLLSTDCPGYYVYGAMSQIRTHVAQGDVDASVKLPKMIATTGKSSSSRKTTRVTQPSSKGAPRRVSRLLDSDASKLLRRKLGSNPGKETEAGVAARRAARASGSTSSRSIRSKSSVIRSSRSSTSSPSSRSSRTSRSSISLRPRMAAVI
jgi:hypothetical protein